MVRNEEPVSGNVIRFMDGDLLPNVLVPICCLNFPGIHVERSNMITSKQHSCTVLEHESLSKKGLIRSSLKLLLH